MSDDVTYGALAVASRRRLLELLRAAREPLDVAALADASGLHPNTVRFHLDVLVRAGLVEEHRQRRGTRGRPRMVYTPVVAARHDEGYQLLAGMLISHLDGAGDRAVAEHAGRAWVRRITPNPRPRPVDLDGATRSVLDLFTEMGFDPATTDAPGRGKRIDLRACPFRTLAEQHPGVVCTLHRGLLRELVEQANTGGVRANLTPFVQPDLCVVDLTTVETPATA